MDLVRGDHLLQSFIVFVVGVKKKMPDTTAAEAFSLELKADRKAILKVDGANSLNSRLDRAMEADTTTMRLAGQRLKEAADRIKRSQPQRSHHRSPNELVPAGFEASLTEASASIPLIVPLLIIGAMATASVVVVITLGEILVISFFAAFTKPTAGTSECVEDLERRYEQCVALANIIPPPFNITPLAACDGERLLRIAGCVVTGQV